MTLTDSEFIIGIFNGIGNLLDAIGSALETTAGSIAIYGSIAAIGVGILLNKIAQ